MKAKGSMALALGTPFVIVLGLLLPDITCFLQDRSAESVARFETNQVQLDIAAFPDATSTLKLLAGEYTMIDLETNDKAGAERAHSALTEALAFLVERGFDDFDSALSASYEVRPFLAVNSSEGRAAKLWNCLLASTENPDIWLLAVVDDASGKVIQFSSTFEENTAVPDSLKPTPEQVNAWARAWGDYLGLESAELVAPTEDEGASAASAEDRNVAIATTQTEDTSAMVVRSADIDLYTSIDVVDQNRIYTLRAE